MNKEYYCKKCSYFFGKEGIHCAVHPYGKTSEYCSDWHQKTLDLQEEKSMNTDMETKDSSYTKLASRLLAVSVTFIIGYQLSQNIPPAIRADKYYNDYKIKCEIFLERASKAGTTGVAKEELAKGVNWLESKSITQSFEYKDLKANLDYLEQQPRNLAMPITITDSISSNLGNIKEKQLKLQRGRWNSLYEYILASILIYLLILVFIAVLEEYQNCERNKRPKVPKNG